MACLLEECRKVHHVPRQSSQTLGLLMDTNTKAKTLVEETRTGQDCPTVHSFVLLQHISFLPQPATFPAIKIDSAHRRDTIRSVSGATVGADWGADCSLLAIVVGLDWEELFIWSTRGLSVMQSGCNEDIRSSKECCHDTDRFADHWCCFLEIV